MSWNELKGAGLLHSLQTEAWGIIFLAFVLMFIYVGARHICNNVSASLEEREAVHRAVRRICVAVQLMGTIIFIVVGLGSASTLAGQ